MKVMSPMKKRFLTLFAAVLLVLAAAGPAFAAVHGNSNQGGDMNSVEEKLLNKFDGIMKKYTWFKHRDQYYEEARAALLDSRIDLDSGAETKFNKVLDDIDAILATCSGQADAWNNHGQEIINLTNSVSKSYKMTVTVDSLTKDATVMIDGKAAGGTASPVKQTGFDLGKTALVAASSVAVLTVVFFVARKKNLFA